MKKLLLAALVLSASCGALAQADHAPAYGARAKAKAKAKRTECMNNCKQIGIALVTYLTDNREEFPYGTRLSNNGNNPTPGSGSLMDPTTWPLQLLPYVAKLKGTTAVVAPKVYTCPVETFVDTNYPYRLDFMANRTIIADSGDFPVPCRSVQMKKSSVLFPRKKMNPNLCSNGG